jgi:hypothetical protein
MRLFSMQEGTRIRRVLSRLFSAVVAGGALLGNNVSAAYLFMRDGTRAVGWGNAESSPGQKKDAVIDFCPPRAAGEGTPPRPAGKSFPLARIRTRDLIRRFAVVIVFSGRIARARDRSRIEEDRSPLTRSVRGRATSARQRKVVLSHRASSRART